MTLQGRWNKPKGKNLTRCLDPSAIHKGFSFYIIVLLYEGVEECTPE
jgi:hypothetical protein